MGKHLVNAVIVAVCTFSSIVGQTVVHDSSLTGTGRSGSPLGIANSGVTSAHIDQGAVKTGKIANGAVTTAKVADGSIRAEKLATATPQAGQVLGFDGTNLVWKTTSSSLRVVDSTGKQVTYEYLGSHVLFLSQTQRFIYVQIHTPGFVENPWALRRLFSGPNCTGAETLYPSGAVGDPASFFDSAFVADGLLYYPTGGYQEVATSSIRNFDGWCDNFGSTFNVNVFNYATMPIGNLGFTPPFKLSAS